MQKSGMSAVSGDVPSRPSWAHSPEREESDEEKPQAAAQAAAAKVAAEHAHHTRVRETTVLDKEAAFKKLRGLLSELLS
ncbi:hypothetical protein R1sor_012166 [Riccia sorocarpa]|uniref:Uncharacterized protein n=1 Tax=Riccia sorocarpa TaxID=122646 RepID=A0ABD3I6U6_9MARC